ncbi:hypothetical protein JW859_08665 [bacterium]|nr:hypothetical protein [bacterium]
MLSKLFSKPDPDRDRIDELASRLSEAGKLDRLEIELLRKNTRGLTARERESWHHLYGICAFRRGEHQLALERFQHGLEACQYSPLIRFSLAQEYIFLGEPAQAFKLFDLCRFPGISSQYALAMSRYAYLFSEYARGIKYIQPLIDTYLNLKILDDNFLFMRALPFFSETWAYLAVHGKLSGQLELLTEITTTVRRTCCDYDFARLELELEAVLTGSHARLAAHIAERSAEARQAGWPAEYLEATLAVWDAQAAGSYEQAAGILTSWQPGPDAPPWLDDVRLLAKAQAAHRCERPEAERLAAEFFLRQPQLFEPSHALNFRFVEYQEVLKPRLPLVLCAN